MHDAAPLDHRSLTVVLMSAELWSPCCFIPNFNEALTFNGASMEVSLAHRGELLKESTNLQMLLLFHINQRGTYNMAMDFIMLLTQHIFINPLTPVQKVKWYFGQFQFVLMELSAARVCSVSLGWLPWELVRSHRPSCKQPSSIVNQNYPHITCGKKMIHAVNFVISLDQVMPLICPPPTVEIHQLNFWGALIWSTFTVYTGHPSVSSWAIDSCPTLLLFCQALNVQWSYIYYSGTWFLIGQHSCILLWLTNCWSDCKIMTACTHSDQQVAAVVDALAQLWDIMTHMVVGLWTQSVTDHVKPDSGSVQFCSQCWKTFDLAFISPRKFQ